MYCMYVIFLDTAKTGSKGLCKAVPLCFKKVSIGEEGSCEKYSLEKIKYYYSLTLQGPFLRGVNRSLMLTNNDWIYMAIVYQQ